MSNDVAINVKVTDAASVLMGKIGANGENMATRVGGALTRMSAQIGGEFAEVGETVGGVFDAIGAAGDQMGTKLAAAGGGVASLGVALMAISSGEKAAGQQLDAAIGATGAAVSDYKDRIEEAISKGEDFGHSGVDVQNALARMTETTGDVSKALDQMTLVENIAAAKHESLTAAAQQLSLAMNGNTKVFKQFGIDLGTTRPTADQLNAALGQLSAKLSGQASAATDTFDGKITSLRMHLSDAAAHLGQEYGPAITAAGSLALIAGTSMDILAAKNAKNAAAAAANTLATEADAVATEADGYAALHSAEYKGLHEAATLSDTAALDANTGAAAANAGAFSKFLATAGPIAAVMGGITIAYDAGTDAAKKHGAAAGVATGVLNALTDDIPYFVSKMGMASSMFDKNVAGSGKMKGSLDLLDGTLNMTATSTLALGKELDTTSTDFKDGADTATRYNNALKGILDTTTGAAESALGFQDSLSQLTASVKTNGTSLAANTDMGRANMEQMLQSIDKINAIADAQTKQHLSTDIVNGTLKDNEDALRKAADAAGYNSDEVDFMIKKYALVPGSIETKAYLDASDALNTIDTLIGKLGYLAGLEKSDPNAYNALKGGFNQFTLSGIKQQATGGIVGAATGGVHSGLRLVGEHGPELVSLPTGSMVHSNPDSQRMAADSGAGPHAGTKAVTFAGNTDSAFAQAFMKLVRTGVIVIG